MNYFDIVIGVIFILAIIKGFKNGLIIELAVLVALVLGIFGAIKFSSITEEWLLQHFQSNYIGVIAFLLTFVGIVLGVNLLAKVIDKTIKAVALGTINRILGALFSLIKYVFIASVLLAVFNSFDRTFKLIPDQTKEESVLYGPLNSFAPKVFPYLYFYKDQAQEKINSIKEADV
ncbi:CvpA family protein [bacterium]|nr:CvpA family protein [bacterium]